MLSRLFKDPPARKAQNKKQKTPEPPPKDAPKETDFFDGLFEKPPKSVTEGITGLSVLLAIVAGIYVQDQSGAREQVMVAGVAGLAVSWVGLHLAYYGIKLAVVVFKIAVILAFVLGALYLFSEIK